MLDAIGSGTRCFTLCLRRAATRLRKRKQNQEGSLFVVCSLCESESATACVGFWGGGVGFTAQGAGLFSDQELRHKTHPTFGGQVK